jgi:transcriptional regulator with GAF, ATPase, and Fis domain
MKSATRTTTVGVSLLICGIALAHPFSAAAQETTPTSQEKPAGKMGMQGMMEKEHMSGMMTEMQQRHEQMEKMHQEMTQEMEKQLTALREHTKAMEGMSDEKQLLEEMKKHQQMTDALLGTMLEQRERMHAQMQARHQQMQKQMGKGQPTEGSGAEQPEGHEAHH